MSTPDMTFTGLYEDQDPVRWYEVDSGEESDDIIEHFHKPLLTPSSPLLHGGSSGLVPEPLYDSFARTVFPVCMMLINTVASGLSLHGRCLGTINGETCPEPLHLYLLGAAAHAAINTLLWFLYAILQYRGNGHLFGKTKPELPAAHNRTCLTLLEVLLTMNAFAQVGMGIWNEAWIGYFGVFRSAPARGCALTAPVLYEYTKYIGLYEDWVVIVMLVLLIHVIVR